jgi:dienelactone hydrolase
LPACLGVLGAALFFGAMMWAKGRDPFQRIWFKVKVPGQGKAECIAVLPKMAARPLPVVVYLYGSGGTVLGSGNDLRQMAEMGLAAVGMDYCQTNEAAFDAQFIALLNHVRRQPWADTNRLAWVGLSLGAQRSLSFALRHPDLQPKLLVRLAGGWVPELESGVQSLKSKVADPQAKSEVQGPTSKVQSPRPKVHGSLSELSTLNHQRSTLNAQRSALLFVHGERDEVFPLSQAQSVAECLRTNGVAAELRVLPGEGHGFGANRQLVIRVIGEECLTRLKGPDALGNYRSILSWQAQAKPLWLFWIPAFLWAAIWLWLRRKVGQASRLALEGAGGKPGLLWWEIGLRWFAAVVAAAALAQTALHLVPPRLPISERTLAIARKHLVPPKERSDFEFLAAKPCWSGKRLKTLLEHVELANYNRELINWKLDEQVYQQFVLSPEIDPAADGDLNWRRPLWENFYPRIRKEQGTEAAAEIVVRFLRERVTIAKGNDLPAVLAGIWERQITNERGFEAVYVAALRSAGVPARLDSRQRAELWTGSTWQAAPRPLVERCESSGWSK